jgi:hypothetical protein
MPSSKPAFLFSATQSVDDRLGDVFSFIWASYAGLRELWWQVRGFRNQFPEIHIKEVEKKFLSGLTLPGGIDIQHLCLNTEWKVHEQEFGKWLLFEACTLYEGWAEKVCKDVFGSQDYEERAKQLQFPTGTNKKGKTVGYTLAVKEANTPKSGLMASEFLPTLKASRLNCWASIEEHLTAYRYFKECRNSFIHSDGFATQEVVDWLTKLTIAQAQQPSPFRNSFSLTGQSPNTKIELNLRDCVLFATVVRKLICTFDAALSVSTASEGLLEMRLLRLTKTSPKWKNLPTDPARREQRVHRMLAASRIPEPAHFPAVMAWMQSKGII